MRRGFLGEKSCLRFSLDGKSAVVMRKMTRGSRGDEGAMAWAIPASVMRTAQQQGRNDAATKQPGRVEHSYDHHVDQISFRTALQSDSNSKMYPTSYPIR
jgi:hypothetical protein